uniref:Uncharacterized protein n=1 Tax=Megaselia scalaris TaxID=36166 RepID=T1GKB8_MEGSC
MISYKRDVLRKLVFGIPMVVICPTSRDDRYSAIKKVCCVESPVASQGCPKLDFLACGVRFCEVKVKEL